MITVYDTEIFKNLLLYVFYEVESKQYRVFGISPYFDQRTELMKYLKTLSLMIGFNNLKFDYPLLHYLIQLLAKNYNISSKELARLINIKSNALIKDSKFSEIRRPLIPQLDLYRVHHFDNVAKATSLKMLEFVFRMPNIEELPYPQDTFLTKEQVNKVINYCHNDVYATNTVYEKSSKEIGLRRSLSEIYNLPMMNWNDPKIGEQILVKFIKETLQKDFLGQSPRDQIIIRNILFDYIQFNSEPFKAIHNWFLGKTITETKKVFGDLPLSEIEGFKEYVNTSKENIVKGRLKTLNVIHNGFQYNFGLGGIHGSIQSGVYEADSNHIILDIDVTSYYPKLGIENHLFPEHMTDEFCNVYLGLFNKRREYPKKSPENEGLKLALNGSYGKSNSKFSPLYDPKYTMSITINGQLLLCMLAEWLSVISDIVMLQINTDGMTIRFNKAYEGLVNVFCKRWEQLTHLNLEYTYFSKLVIRDVNNYLAISVDGKVKRKGAFGYKLEPGEREMHKNHSMLIIPKALEAYYVNGISIEKSIMEGDKWDFFKRVKLSSVGKLVGRSENEENHYRKITRYYVSERGEDLIKVLPPLAGKVSNRESHIEAGFLCTVTNSVNDFILENMQQNINYHYYINECDKIINAINLHQNLEENE